MGTVGKRIVRYLPAVGVAGAIVVLSLLRHPFWFPHPPFLHFDKLAHLVAYLFLGVCLTGALILDHQKRFVLHLSALLPPILLGGLMEILQASFFAPRTGDWEDWLADIIGVFIGYFLTLWLCKRPTH